MKDTELRKRVDKLREYTERLDNLFTRSKDLEFVSIKFCKKCKRRTLQEQQRYLSNFVGYVRDDKYYCLTCGTLWHCEEKTVCKEVEQ